MGELLEELKAANELPIRDSTSVHAAAESGYLEALRRLLEADGKGALEEFDYLSRTPLSCAVHAGQLKAVQLLIGDGADVNARDEARIGDPPLSWAVQARNEEMIDLLLSAGAAPERTGWMQLSALDRTATWGDSRTPALRRIHELLRRSSRPPNRR